jgi:putative membrane protein insertion efficiency factor
MTTNAQHGQAVRLGSLFRIPQQLVMLFIRGYQAVISPALPPSCRFSPSCSQYALEAVGRYGVIKGVWLGTRRLIRCHPFNPGGFDPVP